MKTVFLTILLCIATTFSICAETVVPGSVKGTVIDSKTKQGLEFVNVTVKVKGSADVTSAGMTDSQGDFALGGLKEGDYNVIISCVGYKPITKIVHLNSATDIISLDKVLLSDDSHVLKEVSVVGQRSQMKFEIDKKVFNVGQDVISAGGSATDVLSNIPSVDVDNDGNVSLRGSTNVTIWINGKASGMTSDNQSQILDQLPAESIDHIEVITNPSAKYSAEGNAGIINIVLKENAQKGYLGSLRTGVRSNKGLVEGGSFSYTSNKLEANLDLGFHHMVHDGGSWSNRTNTSANTLLNQNTDQKQHGNGTFVRGGLTYHFTKKSQVYMNGFGIFGHGNGGNTINYDMTNLMNDATIYKSLRENKSHTDITGGNATVGYKYEFTKDHFIDFSSSYDGWHMNNNSIYKQSYENNYEPSSYQNQINNIRRHDVDLQLDYQNKWDENHKIEAGWKTTFDRQNSPIITYDDSLKNDFDQNLYNRFIYNEAIHAGYFTYTGKINKLGYQLGLRGEYTHMNTVSKAWADGGETAGTPYKTNYFKLFPTMFLTYTLPKNAELQLNYSRRINRPWGMQLNNFKNITDSTNISYGNPKLMPQYSNSFELNYIKNWDQQMLSISGYYRTTDDVIQNVSYLDKNVMYSTYMNIAKTTSAGVELVGQNNLFKILNLTTTWDGYYYKLDGFTYNYTTNEGDKESTSYSPQENFTWSARVIANLILPYSWSLQVNGAYNSRQPIAQGHSAPNYSVDWGLKKTFGSNKKWTLAINARDIFNSRKRHSYTSGSSFNQESDNWRNGRIYGVTLTYSFGNMKFGNNKRRPQQQQQNQQEDEDNDMQQNMGE